jgi:PAS domain S-box-containing protein
MADIVYTDPDVEVDLTAEYEQLFETLFQRSSEGILVSEPDINGKIIEANQAVADMHGYTVDELKKLRTSDLHFIKDEEHAKMGLEKMLGGEWIEKDHEHFRNDGSRFPVHYRAGVGYYLGRRVIISFVRDITNEKQVEQDLHQCESQLASQI